MKGAPQGRQRTPRKRTDPRTLCEQLPLELLEGDLLGPVPEEVVEEQGSGAHEAGKGDQREVDRKREGRLLVAVLLGARGPFRPLTTATAAAGHACAGNEVRGLKGHRRKCRIASPAALASLVLGQLEGLLGTELGPVLHLLLEGKVAHLLAEPGLHEDGGVRRLSRDPPPGHGQRQCYPSQEKESDPQDSEGQVGRVDGYRRDEFPGARKQVTYGTISHR